MYSTLLTLHSIFRWLVLAALLLSIFVAWDGFVMSKRFTPFANKVRHWTATIVHLQLLLGILLYTQSPLIKFYFSDAPAVEGMPDPRFFSVIHSLLMLIAIIAVSMGSALAKRKQTDHAKYTTMLLWYAIGLVLILIAIPWPFSPLAQRPLLRTF